MRSGSQRFVTAAWWTPRRGDAPRTEESRAGTLTAAPRLPLRGRTSERGGTKLSEDGTTTTETSAQDAVLLFVGGPLDGRVEIRAARHGEPLPTVTHVHLHDGPEGRAPLRPRAPHRAGRRLHPAAAGAPARARRVRRRLTAVDPRPRLPSPGRAAPRRPHVEAGAVQCRALPAHRGRVEHQQPVEPDLARAGPGRPRRRCRCRSTPDRDGPRRRRPGRGPGSTAAGPSRSAPRRPITSTGRSLPRPSPSS